MEIIFLQFVFIHRCKNFFFLLEKVTLLGNHLKFFPVESISSSEANEQGVKIAVKPSEISFLYCNLSQPSQNTSVVIEHERRHRENARSVCGHTQGARPDMEDVNGVQKTFEQAEIRSETVFHMFRLLNKYQTQREVSCLLGGEKGESETIGLFNKSSSLLICLPHVLFMVSGPRFKGCWS